VREREALEELAAIEKALVILVIAWADTVADIALTCYRLADRVRAVRCVLEAERPHGGWGMTRLARPRLSSLLQGRRLRSSVVTLEKIDDVEAERLGDGVHAGEGRVRRLAALDARVRPHGEPGFVGDVLLGSRSGETEVPRVLGEELEEGAERHPQSRGASGRPNQALHFLLFSRG